MTTLSPFVFWAQNENCVYLKVDLKDVKNPNVKLQKGSIHFESQGVGAKGLNDYAFALDFHGEIDVKESISKITDNRVDFTLSKRAKGWWPRLIAQGQGKPVWLKIDHDKFQTEDMDDEVNDVRQDYPNLYEKLQKEEFGYRKEDFKMVYMSLYNLFMYVGFMYVIIVLLVRYLRDGSDSFPGAYAAVGPAVCFLQLLQGLEILHPLFGYVKGGMFVPFLQIGGRCIVLFLMLELEPRLQVMPVVFFLFMVWSTVEVIRYPYYMSQLFKKDNKLLTWLRYSAWIVLYPIGFVCEGVVIFRNILHMDHDNSWTVTLFDVELKFSWVLRIYMLFIMIPACYTLMMHMYKIRRIKIGPKQFVQGKKKTK